MKQRIGLIVFAVFSCITAFISCDDENDKYLDEYSTILYYNNAGEVPLTLYKTGESTTYEICVIKAGVDLKATTAAVSQLMDNAKLADYNAIQGTNYVMLPSDCYKMESKANVVFMADDTSQLIDVEFFTDKIYELDETINYVLPVELIDSKDSINGNLNQTFIKPSVVIPTLYIKQSGYQNVGIGSNSSSKVKFVFDIEMPLISQWEFDCDLSLDQTILDEYNEENESNYMLLPANSYSWDPVVKFKSGVNAVSVTIEIEKSALVPGGYMLPIKLASCSKETFEIESGSDFCLLCVSYSPDKVVNLTADMLSTNALEPSEGSLAALVDNDEETYFHSAWSWSVPQDELPHYIQINLKEPLSVFKFQYLTRHNSGSQAPQVIVLKGSNDEKTYTSIGRVDQDLPNTARTAFESPVLQAKEAYRYIRLEVPKSAAGLNTYFSMAELKLWGL